MLSVTYPRPQCSGDPAQYHRGSTECCVKQAFCQRSTAGLAGVRSSFGQLFINRHGCEFLNEVFSLTKSLFVLKNMWLTVDILVASIDLDE